MNNPKISVIVPVYNVEQYLPRCIDSILAQTFTDFEILLINDGSTDNSGKICDEYAQKDNRIRVFHKKNGGVSSARNVGLDNAKGEWLAFIDADDWIDVNYLIIENYNNADVIEKSYIICDELHTIYTCFAKNIKFNSQEDFFRWYVNKRNNALWNKIIKRELTIGHYFDNNVQMGEDFLFFLSFISQIQKYQYSTIGIYYYFKRSDSATDSFANNLYKRIQVLWNNMSKVSEILHNDNMQDLRNGIIYHTYVWNLFRLAKYMKKNDIIRLKDIYKEMNWNKMKYIKISVRIKLYLSRLILNGNMFIGKSRIFI